jgi:MFS family permease
MAEWSVIFWMPSVLKETGLSISAVGWLSAIPYAAGAIAMVLVAINSDRMQERKWHMIVASGLSGVFLILAQLPGPGHVWIILALLTLANAAFFGRYGPFWTLPSEVLPPVVMGVGVGLINGAGNLGGVVGPYLFGFLRSTTGSFALALALAGVALVGASFAAVPIRPRPRPKARAVPSDDLPARRLANP